MNSCAIDISDQSIKFGELVATSSGLHLGKYGKEKIPAGVVSSGKIEDEGKLISILKDLKKRYKLYFVRVSLPEEHMYLFELTLPKIEKEKIKEVILLQIEEHVPLKAEDSVFDYSLIREDGDNLFIEVSAISRNIMESYLYVFKSAGLFPLSFELEAEAISRAIVPFGDKKPVMIVDFGDTRTGIFISYGGNVFLTTTISIGGENLTNMIAKNFEISFEEAEKMKRQYGLDGTSKVEDIFPSILNGLSVLRDEILKQYNYWQEHCEDNVCFKKEPVDRIVLCGGDSNLIGLADYLSLGLKVKVEHANVWTNILNIKAKVPGMSFEESLSYTTVLGLALGDYKGNNFSIMNVLPDDEKRKIKKEYKKRLFTIILNIIAVLSLLSTLLMVPSYFFSKSKEGIAEERLESFNRENPDINNKNIDYLITEINTKLNILGAPSSSYKVYDDILINLLENKGDGIFYNQIVYIKKAADKKAAEKISIEIRGVARDRVALRSFKDRLDSNMSFLEVDLPVSSFLEKTNLHFNISIILK